MTVLAHGAALTAARAGAFAFFLIVNAQEDHGGYRRYDYS